MEPSADVELAQLIVELKNVRDAMVGLSLHLDDYLHAHELTPRNVVQAQANQAILRAKELACLTPRRL